MERLNGSEDGGAALGAEPRAAERWALGARRGSESNRTPPRLCVSPPAYATDSLATFLGGLDEGEKGARQATKSAEVLSRRAEDLPRSSALERGGHAAVYAGCALIVHPSPAGAPSPPTPRALHLRRESGDGRHLG